MQIVLVLIFVAVTGVMAAIFMMVSSGKGNLHDRRVRRMIFRSAVEEAETQQPTSLLRKDVVDQSSNFRKQLKQLSSGTELDKLLKQGGLEIDQSTFMIISGGVGIAGAFIIWLFTRMLVTVPVGLIAGGVVPYLVVKMLCKRRKRAITEQFPDAIEMLVSALQAGQGFAAALSLVGSEVPDPLGSEFKLTFDEQNFGVSMKEALEHLRDRVDTVDMEFFVTAVSIQRETGGNLAEILNSLGATVRGRLRLMDHVRALTAQGRMSGWLVGGLPIGIAGALYVMNPDYISQLFTDEMGHYMLGAAVGMQVIGFALIRKIVNIKV